jgi:NAD(P)H-dependent FMN reductase
MPGDPNSPLRFLLFSASLRAGSYNTRLIQLAGDVLRGRGATVDLASMRDFDAPSYDQDIQNEEGFPTGADAFRDRLLACDAFVISSPEYNFSMPGLLKNTIDWVSRYRPQPFNEKQGMLMSASPSMVGGNRGLWSLRVPLEHLGSRLYPDMFSLARAHEAFDDDGRLADDKLQGRFEDTLAKFTDVVEAVRHYPCIKRAWVEHLGEAPDSVLDRVE